MNNLEEEANNVKHPKMTIVVVTDIVLHEARHRVMSALPSPQMKRSIGIRGRRIWKIKESQRRSSFLLDEEQVEKEVEDNQLLEEEAWRHRESDCKASNSILQNEEEEEVGLV